MTRWIILVGVVLLSACAPILAEEPVIVQDAPEQAAAPLVLKRAEVDPACVPNGDGIGGTGCPVD